MRLYLIPFDPDASDDATLSLLLKLEADERLKVIPVVVAASVDNGPAFSKC